MLTTMTMRTSTAKAAKLSVIERTAGQEAALAKELKTGFVGKTVLFVGHSNTVPALLKHLGAKHVPAIPESHYDNLFLVQLHKDGRVAMTRLHYGDANPE